MHFSSMVIATLLIVFVILLLVAVLRIWQLRIKLGILNTLQIIIEADLAKFNRDNPDDAEIIAALDKVLEAVNMAKTQVWRDFWFLPRQPKQ